MRLSHALIPARRAACAAALAAVLPALVCASAPAHPQRTIYQSPRLWATVNVCDTQAHPDTLGVRGSMPGSGRRGERMFMRFQAQYLSQVDHLWHNILQGGDSDFVDVGRATYRARQAGRLFTFQPSATGATQLLRGVVTFEWRRKGVVVRRARKHTTAGHRSAAGADPADFSAATCTMR